MSVVSVVGGVVSLVLVLLVAFFLRCYVFSPSTGRHALDVDVNSRGRWVDVGCDEVGEVVFASVGDETIGQYGIGLGVDDDFPADQIGARPYLEEYWRTSGRHLVDQGAEITESRCVEKGDEYQSVSGQLELVA
ncbi:hypothetical protein AB0L41_45570 [Amycolatopsis mediterranei]|uniref:hypothetical protein n=1 Tax=Amycolatopsis mediterranei TaxID=33910 RepID=UPI0034289DE4